MYKRSYQSLLIIFFLAIFLITGSLFAVAEVRVVEDMAGREVELPEEINRVVTTYRTATQFLFALGAEERMVAIDIGSPRQKLFTSLMPEIEELPTVGSKRHGINLEEVAASHPDLVILYPHAEGPETADKLEEQGIATLIIEPESYELIKETTRLLGEALDLPERTDLVLDRFDQILELVARVEGKSEEERKTVYFANSELTDTVGAGLLQNSMIELAGGINPARDVKKGFVKTSPEQLMDWNPDVVVVSQYYNEELKDLKQDERLQSLKAFKEDNIYRFPSNLEPWDFPSPSSYPGILWLSQKLYPEKYDDINIKEIIDEYYQTLYNKSFTELGGKLD